MYITLAQTMRNISRQFHTGKPSPHHFWRQQHHLVAPMKEKKKKCSFLKEQLADISVCLGVAVRLQAERQTRSVSGWLADFVVNLWESLLTAKLLSEFVIEASVKHLPELFSIHVHICIQHLEPAWDPATVWSVLQHRRKVYIHSIKYTLDIKQSWGDNRSKISKL